MKFLIDNALPPTLADLLVEAAHDAVHVRTHGMHAAADVTILSGALDEGRIVVSSDTDFSAILAAQEAEHPSFIPFREPNLLSPRDYFETLALNLPILEPSWKRAASLSSERVCCGFAGYRSLRRS